ncbi:MAG: hypothetical protein JXA13_09205 [Anaerolineales bacterium]|nr:hypothetical protein [Anaerolineales bacterium]
MRRLPTLIILLTIALGLSQPVQAQAGVTVNTIGVSYFFGEQITFQISIESSIPVTSVQVFFRDEFQQNTRNFPMVLSPEGNATYTFDASERVIRPFAQIPFWFQVELENNESFTSERYSFRYTDNRFEWKEKKEGLLSIYWYTGDEAFGQALLDTARTSLSTILELVPITLEEPVDIYVYPSTVELQGALYLGGVEWAAGHADPDLGVVLASIEPGPEQSLVIEKNIPHELAHILLYQFTGPGYDNLPVWLREGIATQAELYPNPDFEYHLKKAAKDRTLLPISDLCESFPTDNPSAYLAYAESYSFVGFIKNNYGQSGLHAMIAAYSDGMDCQQGAQKALGVSLTQLNNQWLRTNLNSSPASIAMISLQEFIPYIILLSIILAVPVWGSVNALLQRRIKNG